MKKSQLNKLIREEISKALKEENADLNDVMDYVATVGDTTADDIAKHFNISNQKAKKYLKWIGKSTLKEDGWPSLSSLASAVEEEENAYNIAVTIANNIDKYDITATSLGTAIAYILKEKYGKQHSKSLISAMQKELNAKPPPPQDPSEL